MKKRLTALALVGFAGLSFGGEITDPLLKKLYEKGVLTEEEALQLQKEETPVLSKSKKLQFGGKAYIGYTYTDVNNGTDEGTFEVRRGYFITKYYFNSTDYFRFTFDITWQYNKEDPAQGKELDLKVKHLYFNKDISGYVPNTQVEIGIVHTPWLDYEEHSGWFLRAISKSFYEAKDGANVLPSADAGIDFRTRFDYVSAEYGVYNGEGYDHLDRKDKGDKGNKPMIAGRITWHVLGNGRKNPNPLKDTFLNLSLHGFNSYNHRGSDDDFSAIHLHGSYNNPLFLIAGQYLQSDWYTDSENSGDGYSINFEFRPFLEHKIALFGRYDNWNSDNDAYDREGFIYGVAYRMSKYLMVAVNGYTVNYDKEDGKDYTKYMITAEVRY
ncbi:MAG: hypothetical protein GXN94_05725 [Aquificae bacterium]|nr:hypothetical protein [Aquificota bacterium]